MSDYVKKRMEQMGLVPKKSTTQNTSAQTASTQKEDSAINFKPKDRSTYYSQRMKAMGIDYKEITEDDINSYFSDARTYLSQAGHQYDNVGYGNSASMYDDYKKKADELQARSRLISSYLNWNRETMGDDAYSSLNNAILDISRGMNQTTNQYRSARDYYSQWETEEDFQTAYRMYEYQQKYDGQSIADLQTTLESLEDGEEKDWLNAYTQQQVEEDKKNLNIDAAQKEIQELERIYAEYDILNRTMVDEQGEARLEELRNQYGYTYDLKDLISEKKAYLNQAKHIQEGITLSAVPGNDDFDDFSGYATTKSDDFAVGLTSQYGLGYEDLTYEYINNQNGIRDEIKHKHTVYGGGFGETTYEEKGYDHMTEDEVAIYNYYYAKDGKEKAQEYLDSIQETLNQRKGTAMYEPMEDQTLMELAFGVAAGLDQFESGVKSLLNFKDDYIPVSATQYASGMVREDLEDVGPNLPKWLGGGSLGQMGYDTITTTANMAPSIMTSMAVGLLNPVAGQITGTALMGASAAGNAYQEMLNLGYDKGQARVYSALVGGSEAGLQYLLGGIGKLGGKVSGEVITKMMNGVDNAFLRTAIKLGGNMLSEGVEEGLQEILTPMFQNLVLHTDENVDFAEVAYSTLLGALTAGFMEGGSTIKGEVDTYNTGRQLQEADISAQRLAEIGSTFSADTVAYQLAGRVDENTGAYTIGRLFNEIGATLTEQNVNEITEALVKKGVPRDIARENAKAMAIVVEGGNLTDRQVQVIEANEPLAEAVRTTIIDSNATWFQRTKGYNEALMALAQEKVSSDASRTNPAQAGDANTSAEGNLTTDAESGTQGISEALEVDTSPAVAKSFTSIKNGQATIKLEDDTEISAKDAELDPEDGVRIETIASIDGISVSDANYILNTLRSNTGASAQMDALGAKEAYKYGLYGLSKDHMTKHGVFANSLTEAQRQAIYEAGQKARAQQVEATTPKKGTGTTKETGIYFDNGNGDVVAFKDTKKTLTDKQSAGVKAATVLQKLGIGGDIYFFESYLNKKGQRVYKDKNGKEVKAPNGWYSRDGSIHIDLNAGNKGSGFVLFTLSHELTHFIEQWSPQKYKVLADFLVENYEKGQSMDKLVRAKQAKLSADRGTKVSYKEAYSEVVADSMEAMLADGNVMDKLLELKAKDNSLVMKMKQFFDNLVAKIRNVYKGQVPDSKEGRAVMEMTDAVEKIQQLFADALVEASENFQTAEKSTTNDGGVMFMSREIDDVTDETVRADLTEVFNGNNVTAMSYIPVAKTTPFAVRYITRHKVDRPIIVEKKKAYFDMREDGKFKEDSSHHYHGMGVDGFINAMDILEDPEYAIYEQKSKGNVHYAFISSNENGEEICVVFQMNVSKSAGQMNGYPSGYYNLDITEFVATDEWLEEHGVEPGTSYKDYLLSFPENSIAYDRSIHFEQLEKARIIDSESAGVAASYDNNRASEDRLAQDGATVKAESLTPGEEGTVFAENGDPVAHSTEDGTVQLSMRTYEEEGRAAFRAYLEKSVSSKKLTKAEMQEMLDGIEEIYSVCKEFKDKYAPFGTWSDAAVIRDTYGKPVFSVVTPNGDYKMNLDFSLVCKKRRTLDAVFNEMSRRGIIDDFELGQKSVVKINEIIRKHGFETACALCFVDAKRFRQASMADSFTRLYNELVLSLVPEDKRSSIDHFNFAGYDTIKKVEGSIDTWNASELDFSHLDEVMRNYGKGTVEHKSAKYIKTHAEGRKLLLRGDFMSSQGFDAVKSQNKNILSLYNSKKGTGGPKAAFGDVQYMNEIIKKARHWTPAKAYAVGGVRIQSFSDYVPRMVFDYAQMIYDLAATGLPAHAYTKEALFAKQFGLTGVKINMSLIPAIAEGGIAPGLDAKGNYVWAGESFDFETAKQIQSAEGYTENCGTICVGVSDLHIRKLLNDPDIRMVIPYHKSGLNPIVAHMNRIAQFKDYTGSQNTLDQNGSKVAKDFDFDKALHAMGENGDPKAVINQYLEWCDERGYTPKFSQFRDHPNYYKLIEDFTLYDMNGQYVPQREVRTVFPKADSAFGAMKDLIKEGLEEDAVIEGKRDNRLSSIVDEIQQTLPKTEAEIPEAEVEQADRDIEAIQLSDRDSDGNQLSEDQQEFFEHSKARDKNGNLYVLYHGSRSPLFTEFDMYEGVWLTPDQRYAEVYAEMWHSWRGDGENLTGLEKAVYADPDYRVYKMYANITNPLDLGEINDEFDRKQMNRLARLLGVPASRIKDIAYYDGYQTVSFVYEVTKDKQFIDIAREKGYDGFIASEKGKKTFCAFNAPNQVKLTTNEVPSAFNDIRYSDRDSEGNSLTKEQSAFFAQSKARDNAGKLLMLYHGTPRAGFTTFDPSKGKMGGNWFTTSRADADTYAGNYKHKLFDPNERDEVRSSVGGNFTLGSWMRFDTEEDRAEFLKQNPNAETIKTDAEYEELLKKADKARDWDEYERLEDEQYKNRKELQKLQRAYDRYEWEHSRDATVGELFETPERFSVFDVLRAWDALDSNNAARDEEYSKEDLIDGLREEHNRLIEDGEDGLRDFPFKARLPVGETGDIVNRSNNRTYAVYVNAINPFEIDAKQRTLHGANLYPVIEKGLKDSSYDSVIVRNARVGAHEEVGDVVIIKDSGQVKLASNKNPTEDPDIRYQDRSDDSVSNRSLLANAFEGVAQNQIEAQAMAEYKRVIPLLDQEERKLQRLNEQIKELAFAKGPKDTKAIRDLQFEARQAANRINTFDRQLLRMEASKPLQAVLDREKKMAYKRAEQKGKEALAAYKERAIKTQREITERYQESRKKGIESRHKTAMRHKIKDVVNELNQYLLRGTKDRHVPIELQKAVAEALDAVNMDTVGAEERIAKLKDDLLKAKTPEQIQEISRKIDHIQEMGDRMNGRLKKLKEAYDEFVNSDDPLIANSYDEVISSKLQSIIESVGNTPLRDMTLAQLEDVYDMYRMVLTTIQNANKTFKAKKNESISTLGNRVMEEVERVGGKKKLTMKGMDGVKNFVWNNLKPVYAFAHIGSDTFTEIFDNVRAGEDVWAVDVTEAREYYLTESKKYSYDSWDFEKRYKFTSTSGMTFELSLEQIMSLYAYSKREQAAEHLKKGGIVIDESTEITVKTKLGIPVKFNPTEATAYNISDETLSDIVSKLTKEQKGFVDEMQDYLSTVMGAKGNEVSLAMYGVKLFKEKFYFPLKSAQQFMAKAKEQAQGEVKIKNSGFSKETVQKASNPIVLTPFMNVWSNHVNEMSMYHAFVLPMEDFYRVYNYKTPTSETMATESVEMFIQNAYGKGATKYIDQLLKDLNGGARTDHTTGIINKMMGLFKKGAVFASLSVVVQQPSAVARAAALVDTKYFIGPKVDHKRHKVLWDEVKQYAPVAIIKEMGYFDTNMGKSTQDFILGKEYSGFTEKMSALVKDSNYRDELLSKAPALADEIAWCFIWEAVKREINDKYPKMDVKSEAFLKKVGERFTEVIVKTQVYDSVLSRSGLMRSKDTGMKMATAFMAEPTTSINMVADALLQGKRGNRKYARTAIGAVIASQILNSILVSFVYAGRDDDEDNTYLEKYIGTLTGEILDSLNPAGYIPFIKDIVSIVQGYDVERSDMAIISDLWNAWQNLSNDNVSAYRKVEGFAGSIAQIFGLPVKNIMRDARGIYQTIMSFVNGQQTTAAGIGYAVKSAVTGKDVSDQQQLYEAILSGNATQIARVESRFKDQSAINSAIRKALRENDPRIKEAAEARFSGDFNRYKELFLEIRDEGYFDFDTIMAAVNAEVNELEKKASGDTTNETTKSGAYEALFDVEHYYTAVVSNDQASATLIYDELVAEKVAEGYLKHEAEDSIASSFTTQVKNDYLDGEISRSRAVDLLTANTGNDETKVMEWDFQLEHGFSWSERVRKYRLGQLSEENLISAVMEIEGESREGAEAYIDFLDLEMANDDIDITASDAASYFKYAEPAGIDIEVYLDYKDQASKCEGEKDADGNTISGSKKEQILVVIDSMPISIEQKDALYFANGWAESKLNEAPWH